VHASSTTLSVGRQSRRWHQYSVVLCLVEQDSVQCSMHSHHHPAPLQCSSNKVPTLPPTRSSITEEVFTPRRSSYVELKSSKAVQRTIVSGVRVSCDHATTKRLVGDDGVQPQAASAEGRRTQCLHYTLYLLPGKKYRLAATFRVPFKANKDQAFYGQLSSKLSFRLRFQEAKKGVREYLLTEDVKWTGLTQV
jgi:hypothetical protein